MNASATPHHVVILCHPEQNSYTATVATKYCTFVEECGQITHLRDLYRMNFDPVLRAEEQADTTRALHSPAVVHERALIAGAAVIVLVYPIWLGSAPAMLKGYVERVFGPDFALRARAVPQGRPCLEGKHLLSFTSSGNSKIWLDEQGQWQSLIQVFDRYLKHAFAMASTEHVHFSSVVEGLSARFFAQNMEEVRLAAHQATRLAALA